MYVARAHFWHFFKNGGRASVCLQGYLEMSYKEVSTWFEAVWGHLGPISGDFRKIFSDARLRTESASMDADSVQEGAGRSGRLQTPTPS